MRVVPRRVFVRFSLPQPLLFVAFASAVAGVAYAGWRFWWTQLGSFMGPLEWVQFTPSRLKSLVASGKIVVMGCLPGGSSHNRTVLFSNFANPKVKRFVRTNGIVLMTCDWCIPYPIDCMFPHLNLGHETAPFVVVFSSSHPRGKVVITDINSEDPCFCRRLFCVIRDITSSGTAE